MYSIWDFGFRISDCLDCGFGIWDCGLGIVSIADFGFRIKGSEIMIGILSV